MSTWGFASHTPGAGAAETFFATNILNTFEIRTGPTDYASIYEIGVSIIGINTNGSRLDMFQVTTQSVNPVAAPAALVNEWGGDTNTPPGIVVAFYWSTQPVSGGLYRRTSILNSGGTEGPLIQWRFPRGIKMAPSTSLVIRGTGSTNFNGFDYWVDFC